MLFRDIRGNYPNISQGKLTGMRLETREQRNNPQVYCWIDAAYFAGHILLRHRPRMKSGLCAGAMACQGGLQQFNSSRGAASLLKHRPSLRQNWEGGHGGDPRFCRAGQNLEYE